PPRPPERVVPRSALVLSASDDGDVGAAADGDVRTHWIQAIDPKEDGWLQIDLDRPRRLRRLVLDLGSHFGDAVRLYRVATSGDGPTWTPVGPPVVGEAPLVAARRDPDALAVEIALGDIETRHLRIVRPRRIEPAAWDVWTHWARWGIHELHLYEAADA